MAERLVLAKPTPLNSAKLYEELNGAGFVPVGITDAGAEVVVEVYEDWSALSSGQRQARINTVESTVSAHTGSKTAEQLALDAEAAEQQIKEAILEGLANPPAVGKVWITDPALPNKGAWSDPPPGPQGEPGTPGNPGPPGTPALTAFMIPLLLNPTVALTNAPSGGVEPANQQGRAIADLRATVNCQVQALFSVMPSSGGTCRVEYSTDGVVWATLATSGSPHVANVLKAGAVNPVPAGAKTAATILRPMVTGDGVADPVLQKAIVAFIG